MRDLLRIRDARIFLAGWTVSQFGDWALIIVLAVWAKSLTGSNASAGLVFFALAAPSIFAPLAGIVVDRVRRRPLLIAVYSIEAVGVLSLLFVHDRGDVWLLYAMAVFIGCFGTLGASARSALMTTTIPRELLGDGNAIFQSVREGLRLIAPLIGAGIYAAWGGGAVAVIDSVSFVFVVAALLLMRKPEPRFARVEHNFMSEALAGAKHIVHTLPLRQIVFSTGAALLVVGFSETIIFAAIDQGLHRPPSFLGVLSSLQGIGAIAGGLTAARGLRVLGDVRVAGIGMAGFAVGELGLASSSLQVVAVGVVVAGFGVSWFIVGLMTALQVRTPLRLQGRVSSAADVFISTPQTVSIALGAVLISVVDYRLLVLTESVAVALCAAYLLSRRAVVPSEAESPRAPSGELLSQSQP
ncbi:MAG TPA: MFS transporter [Gaiellaceae bacterium]